MRILIKDNYLDLEAPIQMSEKQREIFLKFINKLFVDKCSTKDVEEKTKEYGNRVSTFKKWTTDEYLLLLGPESNDVLAEKMNRSDMSVLMERGHFVPSFMVWAKKKGYTLKTNKKIIQEFLSERG